MKAAFSICIKYIKQNLQQAVSMWLYATIYRTS